MSAYYKHIDEDHIQLWSGHPSDQIPFFEVRQHKGKVIFEIPGGKTLITPPMVGLEFSKILDRISRIALEYDPSHEHKWATRYVTIDGVDCPSGMICSECNLKLSQDALEDLINGQNTVEELVIL